jgi:hypothetical protein
MRRYAHLPGWAAPLGPHPSCWTAQNATTLLLSRCDRYSLATTDLITTGSRIGPNRSPSTTLTPAHPHLVSTSYACTTHYRRP